MNRIPTTIGIALLALGLGLGSACSRDEAKQAASDAKETASEAAAKAGAAADEAAGMAKQKAEAAAAQVETLTDPVARCRELAAKGAWADALDPCAKAHELKPDDMALEHALQQAKAATGG